MLAVERNCEFRTRTGRVVNVVEIPWIVPRVMV